MNHTHLIYFQALCVNTNHQSPIANRAILILTLLLLFGPFLRSQDEVSGNFTYAEPCGCGGVVELTIHNGLYGNYGGQTVPDADEERIGAITIANLNDTDGDGTVDINDYDVSMTPAGRDEVDLMKLEIKLTDVVAPSCPTVEVDLSPELELWTLSTKGTRQQRSIPVSEFDNPTRTVTAWVEARQASATVGNYWISAALNDETAGLVKADRVVVTAVWVDQVLKHSILSRLPEPSIVGIDDFEITKIINNRFVGLDGNRYGYGTFSNATDSGPPTTFDYRIGGRILLGFIITPHPSQLGPFNIYYDISRRYGENSSLIDARGKLVTFNGNRPLNPIQEIPNDDSHNYDEDLTPKADSIFSFDVPSVPRFGRLGEYAQFRNVNFEEFVRISFKNPISGNTLQGSRVSDYEPWELKQNIIMSGNRNITQPYLQNDNHYEIITSTGIKATRPRKAPIFTGTGTINITPNSLFAGNANLYFAMLLPPDTNGNLQWKIEGRSTGLGSSATTTILSNVSQNGPWILNNGHISVEITKNPTNPFLPGTQLTFVVFEALSSVNHIR